MLKARADDLLIFGLTERNIQLLKQGKPMRFSLGPVDLPQYTVAIFYGKDEKHCEAILAEKLLGHVGPDTEIHTLRKGN